MSDTIADFLSNSGLYPRKTELVFDRGFMGRNTVAVPYEEMPKKYQDYLDDLAVTVLDPDGSKVIITGNPMVGKTFLVEQLYANRDIFLKRSGQRQLEFVSVSLDHARFVETAVPGKWRDYVALTSDIFKMPFDDLIYVTESIDAAIGISALGGRVILELSLPTLHHLQKHEHTGLVKQWASWEVIDLNDVYLNKNDLIQLLSSSLLDKLNLTYPEINMTKKHIALFVSYAVKNGELLIDADMDEDRAGYICAQPGIFARAIGRMASLMAVSSEVRDRSGKISTARAIKRTFADFEGIFFSCLQEFMESSEEMSLEDPGIEDAIRNMIEENMPGVRVMSIQGAEGRKLAQNAKKDEKKPEFQDIFSLEKRLSGTVFGQPTAIHSVVEGLKIAAAGLAPETKPRRSLLFLGPTGVGKTQLATSLSKELMDQELPMLRIDMSEFGAEHETSKLLGAPPGYAGHEEGGRLTNFVKANPVSIVLLDEIEKAHPKVWDNFLQILDAGRMTDGKGVTVDFTETIIIMTSNIGAEQLNKRNAGFFTGDDAARYAERASKAESIVVKEVEKTFRPELINRLDQMVIFNELPREILHNVIAREIGLASERLAPRGYVLDAPKTDILDHIATLADASKYGAREVQRVVGKNVYGLLADTVLAGKDKKGLRLALKDGHLAVRTRMIGNKDDSGN